MKDMVTNGTGNSRYLKSSLASGTSWADALALLRAGTFPIDLAGLNNGGITQVGSAYSKANVLPQSVCQALGIPESTAEPKDAFIALNTYAKTCFLVYTESTTIRVSEATDVHGILVGGGGGGGGSYNNQSTTKNYCNSGGGGGSGYIEEFDMTLQPNVDYYLEVGAGGYAGNYASSSSSDGGAGGYTAFYWGMNQGQFYVAEGGNGGGAGNPTKAGDGGDGGAGGGGGAGTSASNGGNGGDGQFGGGGGSYYKTPGQGGTYGGDGGTAGVLGEDGTDIGLQTPSLYYQILRQTYFPQGFKSKSFFPAGNDEVAPGGGGLNASCTTWASGTSQYPWQSADPTLINRSSCGGGGFFTGDLALGNSSYTNSLGNGIGGGGALPQNYGGGGMGGSVVANSSSVTPDDGNAGCFIMFFKVKEVSA